MGCRYTFKGKTYEAHEFDDVLRAMSPSEASAFMPGVQSVPDAPFVGKTDAWVALALKRVIKMAVDEGYDRVAFVTGEQSAERYDLSKHVDRIDAKRFQNDTYYIDVSTKDGKDFHRSGLSAADLEAHVGKEMAQRIVDGTANTGRHVRFSGLDLKVGGEGMRAFYDKIVPSVLKDVLRKVGGGQITSTSVLGPDGEPLDGEALETDAEREAAPKQPGFDITPAMRETVAAGLPRFSTRRPSYGEAQENSISVTGVHYSQQPRQQLDSAFAGTGLKGADIARIEADKGEKKRIYFYVDKGQGILPESGVGGYAHEVQLNNLYDAEADPLFLAEDNPNPTQFERAVTRAGFDGYYRDSFRTDVGAAVLLGQHTVPVAQVGQGRRAPSGEKPARAKAPERTGWRKILADLRASKRLPSGAIEGERWPGTIKRLEPGLYEGMLPSGVFQAIMDRGPMYKDEVAAEYRVRARPSDKTGPAADLDEKQQQLFIGQYLDSFELRGEEPFKRNRDLGAFLERRALKVHGQPLTENTPESREFIAKVLAAETKRALARDGHAGQWYKTTLAEALKTAEDLHPELATDQDARFVFTFALAITSNGQTIADNTRMAFEAYEAWKKRGVLPSRVEGGGDRAGTMVRAFQDFNGMIRNPGGIAATRYALLRKWPAKELRDSSGKNLSSALADEEVYGGVLFGPKIGGAFLQNLNGNFDALTIDRWLMRTWGRMTGRLTDSNSKTGLRDAPTSAGERAYIRQTLEQALEQVRASGEQIDMADLQASLWYPEKELYNTLARPDTRADPTDYAQEFKAYVQAQRAKGRPARGEGARAGRDAERRPRPVVSPQQGLFSSPNRAERDARSGTPLLNIGLDTRGGDRPVTPLDVRRALDDVGARVVGTWQYQSDTEPTMVVQLAEPLPPAAVDRLSAALRQEAIAQFDGEQGGLYGPQAEKWGDFNPEFFIMPDGRRMSAPAVDVVELRKQASVLRSLRKCLLA